MLRVQTEPTGPVEYIFVLPGADYTVVSFKEQPEMDFTISRGAVLDQATIARLTPFGRAVFDQLLKTGGVIARPVGKE